MMIGDKIRSPCLECKHGSGDKNSGICVECEKRITYLRKTDGTYLPLNTRHKREEKMDVKAAQKTKICSRPDCSNQGKPQPLGNFSKRAASKDGLASACKDCAYKDNALRRKQKAFNKKSINISNQPADLKLTLDFTEHSNIYESLLKASREDLRQPEMQALFFLKEALYAPSYSSELKACV